jgi:hypothetical protein
MSKFWVRVLIFIAVIFAASLVHNLKAMRCVDQAKWTKELDTVTSSNQYYYIYRNCMWYPLFYFWD